MGDMQKQGEEHKDIIFYVNTITPSFRIDFFRMGWYNGLGGTHMMSEKDLKGVVQNPLYNFNDVLSPSQEHHNQITINHHSPTNISEKNEISFYIASQQSETSLDSYNKDERIRPERLFICPYCPKFTSTLENEYQRHIVLKHPGKSGYPNTSSGIH
ncbi:MAG: hypothetical protein WAK17_00055 [Candidatus Nitrosopolaris sp.]